MTGGNKTRQLKILVDTQLASAFKAACKESGVSMAKELTGYMEGRAGVAKMTPSPKGAIRVVTRKDRRGAMRSIVAALAAIRDAEEAFMESIPENLKNGPAYESAESAVCMIDEAIALLDGAFE